MELRGGFANGSKSPLNHYAGFAVSGYTKRADRWVIGTELSLIHILSASYLFPTPEKTAETGRSELMEALKDTYFMEKNGSRLMDIRPEEALSLIHICFRSLSRISTSSGSNGKSRKRSSP